MHLVFPCKDKSTTLLYKLEPSTLITLKVDQVKDKVVVKKETKKGKPALKKAKVKEEEEGTPQIKVCLLLYKYIIILNIYPFGRSHHPQSIVALVAIRGFSGPLVNLFSAFSDEPSLKIAKLPACYTLKFSSLNLVVRAILTLPYLVRFSGPYLSDSRQWDNMLGV